MNNDISILKGSVFSIPLIIEDIASKEVICQRKLYVHVTKQEVTKKEDNYSFVSRQITAIAPEGCYHNVIDKARAQKMKRMQCDDSEWESIIDRLFPLTTTNDTNEKADIIMEARLSTKKENYHNGQLKEDTEILNDYVTITLKTKGRLSKTWGSIELSMVDDEEEDEDYMQEQDVFNWIDHLDNDNQRLCQEVTSIQEELQKTNQERTVYKQALQEMQQSHKRIITDLEDKFYRILEAKKQRIVELERFPDKLEGLNHDFIERNKLNLNRPLKREDLEEISDVDLEEYLPKRKKRNNKKDMSPQRDITNTDRQNSPSQNTENDTASSAEIEESDNNGITTSARISDKQIADKILGRQGSEDNKHEDNNNNKDNADNEQTNNNTDNNNSNSSDGTEISDSQSSQPSE